MAFEHFIVLTFIASSVIMSVSAGPRVPHNPQHLEDHIESAYDFSNMTEGQMRFVYFHSHDTDGNGKLDGNELMHCILHHVEKGRIYSDAELSTTIDPILAMVDRDFDGFIDYAEYLNEPRSLGIGYLTLFLMPYSMVR